MSIIDDLTLRHETPHALSLTIRDVTMELRSNVASVIDSMRDVYARYVRPPEQPPRYSFWAIDGAFDMSQEGFADYVLPSGKAKERYRDDGDLRFVVKKKTGLWTIFGARRYLVIGPVAETTNQLNNIINAVYMKDMDERGWLICQTAALALDQSGFVLAGRSGAGKTTTLLKLMAAGGSFISNDRLLVRASGSGNFEMWGIAKWPRANAGTMMGDEILRSLVPPEAAARYSRMSYDELFRLEEKYDVDVEKVYGPGRFREGGTFRRIYYLMWSRDGEGFGIDRVNPADDAFWSEFGPNLYRDAGVFDRRLTASIFTKDVERRYREVLQTAEIFAVRGKVDFPRIGGAMLAHMRDGR